MQSQEMMTTIDTAEHACHAFNQKMKTIFPNFKAVAVTRNILGKVVAIEFANAASREDCPSGILMNASGYMRFLMGLSDSKGNPVEAFELDMVIRGYNRDIGPKFRKIKGKTPEDSLLKLAAWFEKNKDCINSL